MTLPVIMISAILRNYDAIFTTLKSETYSWGVNRWHISSDKLQRRFNVNPVEYL